MNRFVRDDVTRATTFFALAFAIATAVGLLMGDLRLGIEWGLPLGVAFGVFAYFFVAPADEGGGEESRAAGNEGE